MKDKIIIINGLGGCGKSTFVSCCKEYGEKTWNFLKVYELSSIDFVKKIASTCGWDGTKTTENRTFLHNLKTLLEDWNDVPTKKVLEEINCLSNSVNTSVFFVNIREDYNIDKFKSLVNLNEYDCYTLIVKNKNIQTNEVPELIKQINNYKYDIQIENNKNLNNLQIKAMTFMQDLIEEMF